MTNNIVVEVKTSDVMDTETIRIHSITDGDDDNFLASLKIFHLMTYLEEEVGGSLCFLHFCLPRLKNRFEDKEWLIEVECCCKQQSKAIEERVKNIFNHL